MNYYFFIYTLSIITAVFWWIFFFKQYRNKSWFYFLIFSIFSSIWMFLYFLFLIWWKLYPQDILFLSKNAFFTSLVAWYSFLFFIFYFDHKKWKIFDKYFFFKLFILFILWFLTINTDLIIKDVVLNDRNIYREIPWKFFIIYQILYLTIIPTALFVLINKEKKLDYINKLRLRYIMYPAYFFIWSAIFFQIILPIFWIWFFEKEIVFLFMIFILSTIYTIKRYYLYSIWYWLWKVSIWILSIIVAFLWINLINFFHRALEKWFNLFLWVNDNNWNLDIIIWIVIFFLSYKILSVLFLWKIEKYISSTNLNEIEKNISYILNFNSLNNYLNKELNDIFKVNYSEIIKIENLKNNEIFKFFKYKKSNKFFINDLVFIEENQECFDKEKIINSLPKKSFLIFPIYNSEKENIWIFTLWTKFFGDFYNIDEINILERLVFFLEYHLKYIENYEQLTDLNINLDKKVDEKTIEYNNLINKQKEFISMISHELRSPISSAVFQADSIIDDLDLWNFDKEKIKSELEILNSLLIKTWDLSSKLFSVQYYDTHSITLYKEKVQISNLLKNELEIYSHINEKITFTDKVDKNIWFVEIDKIQFQQVIENILSNAIKFIQKNWTIKVEAYKKNWYLTINIEDDWKWFEWIETTQLFEKYSTWNWNYVWLWMWLYLCKKIIDMHKWEIIAESSKELWWAKFIIKIPIQ